MCCKPARAASLLLILTMAILLPGCGPNPLLQGKPAPPVKAQPPASNPVAGEAAVPPAQAPVQEGGQPTAKTPLIRGISELLNTNPALEDDTKNPLREQLKQADDILSGVKSQNRAALRQVNRQQRLRRSDAPNIVLIVIDELSTADLSSYSRNAIQTPHLDQLAASGTKFTQFYAGGVSAVAARWCLATGRRPDEAGTWSNSHPVLQSEDTTIAEAMWQAGYTTGLFGDWGALGPQGPATPTDQGFDEWLGAFASVDAPQPFPASVLHNGQSMKLLKNADGQRGQLVQDFYVIEAADFLARHYRQRPLFLQLNLTAVADAATPADVSLYADQPWSDAAKARAAAITRLDRDIGALRKKLDEIKQSANTIFIVTSATPGNPVSATSPPTLRGGPGDLYEGGLRVPLIVSGTRRIPAGGTCAAVSAAWDLGPTIYELVGALQRPTRKAGQSLVPFMKAPDQRPKRFLYWEARHGTPEIAARWQDWKVVRPQGQAGFELYDLSQDPGESQNVADQHPEIIAEIQKRITPIAEQARR